MPHELVKGRRRNGIAVLAGFAVLLVAPPAVGHDRSASGSSDHRAELLGLHPADTGVQVRLVDDGTRIELDAGAHDVVVLGYEGEPYLRVGADGAFENLRSPSTYLNRSIDGDAPPPEADPDAIPDWRRISGDPIVRWHDHALHVPPGQRTGARTETRWARPLEIDGAPAELRGRIVTLASPATAPWLALAAVLAVAVLLAGRAAWRLAMVMALSVLVAADAARLYGLAFGPPAWLGSRWQAIVDASTLSVIGWGLAVAAVVLLRSGRRLEAAAAIAVAGGVLAVTGGMLELDDLGAARLGSALPDAPARAVVALVLGVGLGALASAVVELRRASSTSAQPAPRSDTAPNPADGTRTGSPARPPSD